MMRKQALRYRSKVAAQRVVVGILGGLLVGCSVDFTAGRPGGPSLPENVEDVVVIQIRNFAVNEAVDVQFHATNDPVVVLPDELFVPENGLSSGIGVAGTGIIQPLDEDTINFPCTPDLTIGTSGGLFLDNDTGELKGVGQRRWLQDAPLSLCGRLVTFDFSGASGDFTTSVSVTDLPGLEVTASAGPIP